MKHHNHMYTNSAICPTSYMKHLFKQFADSILDQDCDYINLKHVIKTIKN